MYFGPGWGFALFAFPIIGIVHLVLTPLGFMSKKNKIFFFIWLFLFIATVIYTNQTQYLLLSILIFFMPQIVFIAFRNKLKSLLRSYAFVFFLFVVGYSIFFAIGFAIGANGMFS